MLANAHGISAPFFRVEIKRVLACPGQKIISHVRNYMSRRGEFAPEVTALRRTRNYQARTLDADPEREVLHHEYRDRGSGLSADELFDLVDKGRRRAVDGQYKRNAGRAPCLGLFLTLSFPRGQTLERCRGQLGEILDFLETRYCAASESAIHEKFGQPDHVHILMPDVAVGPEGVAKTKIRELNGIAEKCASRGVRDNGQTLAPAAEEIRSKWAEVLNRDLSVPVDHRSYARQGLDLQPLRRFSKQCIDREKRRGAEIWRQAREADKHDRAELLDERRRHELGGDSGFDITWAPDVGDPAPDEHVELLLSEHTAAMERVERFTEALVVGLQKRVAEAMQAPPGPASLGAPAANQNLVARRAARRAPSAVDISPPTFFGWTALRAFCRRPLARTVPSEARVAIDTTFALLHLLWRLMFRKTPRRRLRSVLGVYGGIVGAGPPRGGIPSDEAPNRVIANVSGREPFAPANDSPNLHKMPTSGERRTISPSAPVSCTSHLLPHGGITIRTSPAKIHLPADDRQIGRVIGSGQRESLIELETSIGSASVRSRPMTASPVPKPANAGQPPTAADRTSTERYHGRQWEEQHRAPIERAEKPDPEPTGERAPPVVPNDPGAQTAASPERDPFELAPRQKVLPAVPSATASPLRGSQPSCQPEPIRQPRGTHGFAGEEDADPRRGERKDDASALGVEAHAPANHFVSSRNDAGSASHDHCTVAQNPADPVAKPPREQRIDSSSDVSDCLKPPEAEPGKLSVINQDTAASDLSGQCDIKARPHASGAPANKVQALVIGVVAVSRHQHQWSAPATERCATLLGISVEELGRLVDPVETRLFEKDQPPSTKAVKKLLLERLRSAGATEFVRFFEELDRAYRAAKAERARARSAIRPKPDRGPGR